ncbi:hypothetical protein JF634_11605 [Simonsiella muelleri]|uniref:hypothetical protein n=1 Tax=Simonsiella muelleri TaxID=72 RepID=UPI001319E378|nr:hypothetical protein [Simonsiella muelleri]UBQ53782.1 hypothetical protein JF634_11605 [Simonsiella muelleri]
MKSWVQITVLSFNVAVVKRAIRLNPSKFFRAPSVPNQRYVCFKQAHAPFSLGYA